MTVARSLLAVSTTLLLAGCGSGLSEDPVNTLVKSPVNSPVNSPATRPVGRLVDDETEPARLDQAALLAASCSGCHAGSGSADGIASLDGMAAAELESRLLAYRNETDGGSAMHRMARGYSERQIAMIANALGD